MTRRQRSVSEAIFRALLRLYPGEFRRSFEEPMVQAFRDLRREADAPGSLRRFAFSVRILSDLWSSALLEWAEVVLHRLVPSPTTAGGTAVISLRLLPEDASDRRIAVASLALLLPALVLWALCFAAVVGIGPATFVQACQRLMDTFPVPAQVAIWLVLPAIAAAMGAWTLRRNLLPSLARLLADVRVGVVSLFAGVALAVFVLGVAYLRVS